jgi:hypothetical protein
VKKVMLRDPTLKLSDCVVKAIIVMITGISIYPIWTQVHDLYEVCNAWRLIWRCSSSIRI